MPVTAYADGACLGNPGPGGWGVYMECFDGSTKDLSGSEASSTNNKMELMAATVAIEESERGIPLILVTDSKYVIDGITKWIGGWKRRGWMSSTNEPVKNKDSWMRLDAAARAHGMVTWRWVKGHSGNVGNERADRLATSAASKVAR